MSIQYRNTYPSDKDRERERTGDPAKTGKQSMAKDKAWSREETWPATIRGASRGKDGSGEKRPGHGISWRVKSREGLLLL